MTPEEKLHADAALAMDKLSSHCGSNGCVNGTIHHTYRGAVYDERGALSWEEMNESWPCEECEIRRELIIEGLNNE